MKENKEDKKAEKAKKKEEVSDKKLEQVTGGKVNPVDISTQKNILQSSK